MRSFVQHLLYSQMGLTHTQKKSDKIYLATFIKMADSINFWLVYFKGVLPTNLSRNTLVH